MSGQHHTQQTNTSQMSNALQDDRNMLCVALCSISHVPSCCILSDPNLECDEFFSLLAKLVRDALATGKHYVDDDAALFSVCL